MLTQKMAEESLLVYLQIDSQENKKALRQTATLFDKTLQGLKHGDRGLSLPGTQEESIRVQLDVVIDIWNRFRPVQGKVRIMRIFTLWVKALYGLRLDYQETRGWNCVIQKRTNWDFSSPKRLPRRTCFLVDHASATRS